MKSLMLCNQDRKNTGERAAKLVSRLDSQPTFSELFAIACLMGCELDKTQAEDGTSLPVVDPAALRKGIDTRFEEEWAALEKLRSLARREPNIFSLVATDDAEGLKKLVCAARISPDKPTKPQPAASRRFGLFGRRQQEEGQSGGEQGDEDDQEGAAQKDPVLVKEGKEGMAALHLAVALNRLECIHAIAELAAEGPPGTLQKLFQARDKDGDPAAILALKRDSFPCIKARKDLASVPLNNICRLSHC